MFSIYNHKINFFYCLDTGLYICSNCDSYIPSTNKVDWLEHTQAFHETEFNKFIEIQKMLTRACNSIKVDNDEVMSKFK
jgi:hypothetical protein